jgi:hypothetical protein
MDRKRFEKLAEQALARLPEVFRRKLTNVAIVVEDLPPEEADRDYLLLGYFHGVPLTQKSTFQVTLPDRIVLYRQTRRSGGKSAPPCSTNWATSSAWAKTTCATYETAQGRILRLDSFSYFGPLGRRGSRS